MRMFVRLVLLFGFASYASGAPEKLAPPKSKSVEKRAPPKSKSVRPIPDNVDVNAIRQLVSSMFKSMRPEALLFGLYRHGKPVYTDAFGYANRETKEPASTSDHFRIGGITETMLSTLYFILLEKGDLDPTQKLSVWYPTILNADKVTLGMLAANSAGYFDYARSEDFAKAQESDPYYNFTPLEMVSYATADGKMNFEPGTSQQYSHTDMLLFYLMVEKQTGRTIGSLYNKYLFKPVKMSDSRSPALGDNTIHPSPVLHAYQSTINDLPLYDATYWSTAWFQGYGIVTSNLDDLGKWGEAFCTHQLISDESFETQTKYQGGFGSPDRYFGYGVVVNNGYFVQNPSLNGYYGAWACDPETGHTFVAISTLQESTTTDVPNVAFAVLEAVVKQVNPVRYIDFS